MKFWSEVLTHRLQVQQQSFVKIHFYQSYLKVWFPWNRKRVVILWYFKDILTTQKFLWFIKYSFCWCNILKSTILFVWIYVFVSIFICSASHSIKLCLICLQRTADSFFCLKLMNLHISTCSVKFFLEIWHIVMYIELNWIYYLHRWPCFEFFFSNSKTLKHGLLSTNLWLEIISEPCISCHYRWDYSLKWKIRTIL